MKLERNAVNSQQYHKVSQINCHEYLRSILPPANFVRLCAVAVIQTLHDTIHECSGQLFNVQRAARKLERVRKGSAKLPYDRSDLSLARELH